MIIHAIYVLKTTYSIILEKVHIVTIKHCHYNSKNLTRHGFQHWEFVHLIAQVILNFHVTAHHWSQQDLNLARSIDTCRLMSSNIGRHDRRSAPCNTALNPLHIHRRRPYNHQGMNSPRHKIESLQTAVEAKLPQPRILPFSPFFRNADWSTYYINSNKQNIIYTINVFFN